MTSIEKSSEVSQFYCEECNLSKFEAKLCGEHIKKITKERKEDDLVAIEKLHGNMFYNALSISSHNVT